MSFDYKQTRLQCETDQAVVGAINSVMPQIPTEMRFELNRLKLAVLQTEGYEGLRIRFLGRTVEEILSDQTIPQLPDANTLGEIDGISYVLFDAADNPCEG